METLIQTVSYRIEADRSALLAKMYFGRARKPVWFYKFRNAEHMETHIQKAIAGAESILAQKAQHKLDLKVKKAGILNEIQIGSVFCWSWGWEQTNVNFYQVIAKSGSKLTVREIGFKTVSTTSSMSDNVVPVRDDFIGSTENVILNNHGSIKRGHGWANLTDYVQSHYRSWYA